MCLIALAYQYHDDYPLIVVANRDEYHYRPTATLHRWPQPSPIIAGQDLTAGGTWLGISKTGRFAAVTNFRAGEPNQNNEFLSRGQLCANALSSSEPLTQHLNHIEQQANQYAGFNLLLGNSEQLYYLANHGPERQKLSPGVHALSNGALNNQWPKVTQTQRALQQTISTKKPDIDHLFALLTDKNKAADWQLPNTGIDLEKERLLSSRFIISEDYGTRSSAVILFHRSGSIDFFEQHYDNNGEAHKRSAITINAP